MPHATTATKRKYKVLNYTTDEFISKLLTRGYAMNIPLRNELDAALLDECQKDGNLHNKAFWQQWFEEQKTQPSEYAKSLMSSVIDSSCLNVDELCECLCPLHSHDINYVNLVVVLHTLNVQQWKNFYRFCYLEWTKHDASKPLWIHTPRTFASFEDAVVCSNSLLFLRHMVQLPQTDHRVVRSLFVVNRIFQYLLPVA